MNDVPTGPLERIEAAFTQGLSQPAVVDEITSGRMFGATLNDWLRPRINASEFDFYTQCCMAQGGGIAAIRRGDLEHASATFRELRTRLKSARISNLTKKLISALVHPGEAYLCHRRGEYEEALASLHRANELDDELVEVFDFSAMSAHRLQLALNVMRVHTCRDQVRAAVSVGRSFLDYLEFGTEVEARVMASPRESLRSVPSGIVDWYVDKFGGELGMALGGRADSQGALSLSDHLRCESPPMGKHAHLWLRTNWHANRLDDEYEPLAVPLLSMGRQREKLLFFTAVLDAVSWCRNRGAAGQAVADDIWHRASQQPDVPYPFRRC